MNRRWKLALKISLSATLLIILFVKADLSTAYAHLSNANLILIAGALAAFNLSQLVSALRSMVILQKFRINEDLAYHTKLYYWGMFYNLLVPGGVGGDGVKIYHLKQKFGVRTKYLLQGFLFARLSGLLAILLSILLLQLIFHPLNINMDNYFMFSALGITVITSLGFYKFFFKRLFKLYLPIHLLALVVQLLQGFSIILILYALDIHQATFTYLIIFYISSILLAFPISFGGIGLRETIFYMGATQAAYNSESALIVSMLFSLITIISSLPGAWAKPEYAKASII